MEHLTFLSEFPVPSLGSFFVLIQFSRAVTQSCLFVTPWTGARQASLSITIFQSLLKLMAIESVMPSNHLILCRPLLLLPSIFPSIQVFSNESALRIRWPKYWSFSFSISPSNEHPGLGRVPNIFPEINNFIFLDPFEVSTVYNFIF